MSHFCYQDETCRLQLCNIFPVSLNGKQKAVLLAYQNLMKSNHQSLSFAVIKISMHGMCFYQNFICLLLLNCSTPTPITLKALTRRICNKQIAGAYLNLLIGKNLHIHHTGNQSGDITVHATGWHPPLLYTKSQAASEL